MATITWAIEADFDRNGTYETALTDYIDSPGSGISISRGIGRDGKPLAGQMGLTLSNRDGTFTPENSASSLYGKLQPGVPIRITATVGSSYTVWTGYIMAWRPKFEAGKESTCDISSGDIITILQDAPNINVTASALRDTDAALVAICDAIGFVAGDRNFDDGVQALPMHFASDAPPLQAMMDVVASEMGGQLYPDATGRIRFEARNSRLGTTVDDTWGDGTLIGPQVEEYTLNPLEYVTSVSARATVFQTGQSELEVFRFSQSMDTRPNADSMLLTAGQVYERDFNLQSAIAAITSPVASTDYQANDAIDGSGTDRTSSLSVTVTAYGGARFRLRLKNTHSGSIYVTRFRLRGQPVEFHSDRAEASFTLSVPGLKAGRGLQFDVPFGGDSTTLRDYAYQELRVGRYPWPMLRLRFQALLDDAITALLAVELGDLVKYKSASDLFQSAGVDDWWYVEGLSYKIPAGWAGEMFECEVLLSPSYVYRDLDHIVFDTFERGNATGDLGTSLSGATWSGDTGFDIASNAARPNSTARQAPYVEVTA